MDRKYNKALQSIQKQLESVANELSNLVKKSNTSSNSFEQAALGNINDAIANIDSARS